MTIDRHTVASTQKPDGLLFMMPALTLQEQRAARRASLADRVQAVARLVAEKPEEPWLIWCELNDEGDSLQSAIPGAVQVAGKDTDEAKTSRVEWFKLSVGGRALISKPTIFGYGLNLQHCANVAFVGLSHSYEQFYQAVRRCWRFGQEREVNVHVVTSDLELAVLDNVMRKEADAQKMAREMIGHMKEKNIQAVKGLKRTQTTYAPRKAIRIPSWLVEDSNG
jgi:hypothetical protein